MSSIRLTRRGKIVLTILFTLLMIWALNATTPKECKVPASQMSQACLDLLMPN